MLMGARPDNPTAGKDCFFGPENGILYWSNNVGRLIKKTLAIIIIW